MTRAGDRAAEPASSGLAAIGRALRGAGLTPRAIAAWAGTARLAALPARLDGLRGSPTPAAAILALFVAGAEVARGRLRIPGALLDALIAHGLVECAADRVRACVAVMPLGGGLLVCDRLDAPVERALVCWPDDSSHHLAAAIPPGRRDGWLDLGCGSAFAALARPELAARIAGVDVNERAVRYARLGAALSELPHVAVAVGDVGDARDPADLVTCNAPMPEPAGHGAALPEVWRRADPGFFARLWPALRAAVRPGGMIVVHAACDALLPVLGDARGERACMIYTPDGVPGFAVAWLRPDAPERLVTVRRTLTADRPHVDARDRDGALAQRSDASL